MYNLILNTDSYKTSHFLQYPPHTEYISSYIESRGGRYQRVMFFGLQQFIKAYLCTPICQNNIEQAQALLALHGVPFNRQGWQYILDQHQGYLPVRIEAVPEGSYIPTSNVMLQIINTDPQCAWLTSYLETALLRAIWYPSTVATISKACHNIIRHYLNLTANDLSGLPFKLHDFGPRGASSEETTALGGLAHLVNFKGTDNLSAIVAGINFYHEPMAGFSIPAAEHSTITSWGESEEAAAYANMIHQFGGKNHVFAVVSDSYDLWHAIDNLWGKTLKSAVQNNGGTLVIRPDSGDPVAIVPEVIERLMHIFGASLNNKGFRLLPNYVRVIQGDGISAESIESILQAMLTQQQSADNITFGMGGELLQKINRDTQRFAMKVSAVCVKGQWRDVFKDPVTDHAKRSKKGRLALVCEGDDYHTIRQDELNGRTNILQTVFENGRLIHETSLEQIRLLSDACPCQQ